MVPPLAGLFIVVENGTRMTRKKRIETDFFIRLYPFIPRPPSRSLCHR
jgi:hypothetical protein